MCKQSYEKLVKRSGKIMLLCKLKSNQTSEIMKLCICQRFCPDKDKYIPHQQKSGCKYYERKSDVTI